MTEAPELRPCPFCGSEPYTRTIRDEDLSTHATVDWHFVGCSSCDISFGIPDGYDCGTASEQWNTRTELANAAYERGRRDMAREAEAICDEERHNTNVLTSYPPQSAGVVAARNRICALIPDEKEAEP